MPKVLLGRRMWVYDLDGGGLGVEVCHKLVQGAKVLLNLACKVPARRLVLLRSTHTCPSPASEDQIPNASLTQRAGRFHAGFCALTALACGTARESHEKASGDMALHVADSISCMGA